MIETIQHKKSEHWGIVFFVTEITGKAFGRAYIYNDQQECVYLDWLSVSENHRRKGIGKQMQLIRENIGLENGATKSVLWVKSNTWQQNWYKRRGYVDAKPYSNENAIWMEKDLTKPKDGGTSYADL